METARVIKTKSQSAALKAAIIAIMAALTTVMTMVVSIYIPASQGFFNIGESIIYLSAILFGPYIGALTAGIGSMTADLLLGYANYAPGTLIIKGIEGFIVGYLYQRLSKVPSEKNDKWFRLIFLSGVIGLGAILFISISNHEYQGLTNLWELTLPNSLGDIFWIILTVLAISILIIIIIRKRINADRVKELMAMLVGGTFMVAGYLIYGYILYQTAAFIEIPFNYMQCFTGMLISIPLINPIRRISNV